MESSVVCEEVVWSTGQAWCVCVWVGVRASCVSDGPSREHSRVEMSCIGRSRLGQIAAAAAAESTITTTATGADAEEAAVICIVEARRCGPVWCAAQCRAAMRCPSMGAPMSCAFAMLVVIGMCFRLVSVQCLGDGAQRKDVEGAVIPSQ